MATVEPLSAPGDLLTPRQLEVLELLAKGLTNREIAGVLEISAGTVKNHVAALLDALDVTNRTEAAVVLSDWAAAGEESPWSSMGGGGPGDGSTPSRLDDGGGEEWRVPGFGDRPAIAVLPFDDWSAEPRAFFAEGLAEDLITRLAAWRWFPVIARNSSFGLEGPPFDVREASRRLGARYVVEGSVRVEGTRARVTAQLLDGPTGQHLWADRWDVVLDEVFDAQDEIVERIVAALEPALSRVERMRALARPVDRLTAWETAQRALHHLWLQGGGDLAEARNLFARCIEIDSGFAPGHWGLSLALLMHALYGVGGAGLEFGEALRHGERAAEIDPLDAMAHLAAAGGRMLTGRVDASTLSLEHAVSLNPSSALCCAARAWRGLDPTNADASAALLERAARLSPLDPIRSHFYGPLAFARLAVGRYEDALEWARRSVEVEAGATFTYQSIIASSLAHLGREAEARAEGERLLARIPDADHGLARLLAPPETFAIYLEGLERAGISIPG